MKSDTYTDTERLDRLEQMPGRNLVNDDNGRWAISDSGMQEIPGEDGFKEMTHIVCLVEPEAWRPTIREAIDAYLDEHPESHLGAQP